MVSASPQVSVLPLIVLPSHEQGHFSTMVLAEPAKENFIRWRMSFFYLYFVTEYSEKYNVDTVNVPL
jgi:hypothetical protein